jgi:hypothetical protein
MVSWSVLEPRIDEVTAKVSRSLLRGAGAGGKVPLFDSNVSKGLMRWMSGICFVTKTEIGGRRWQVRSLVLQLATSGTLLVHRGCRLIKSEAPR